MAAWCWWSPPSLHPEDRAGMDRRSGLCASTGGADTATGETAEDCGRSVPRKREPPTARSAAQPALHVNLNRAVPKDWLVIRPGERGLTGHTFNDRDDLGVIGGCQVQHADAAKIEHSRREGRFVRSAPHGGDQSSLHLDRDAAKIEKSVVVLKEETRGGTSVGHRRRGRQSPTGRPADR